MTIDDRIDPVVHPDGHPDDATLSGLDAEVFDEATASQLRAHVDSCAQCSATLRSVADVRQQLAALPAPRMPQSVARRLEEAIRGEQRVRATASLPTPRPPTQSTPAHGTPTQPPPPAIPTQGNVRSMEAARARKSRTTRWMSAVAAGVVVLAAGSFAIVNAVNDDDKTGTLGIAPGDKNGEEPDGNPPGPELVPQFSESTMPDNVSAIIKQAPVTADNSEVAGKMANPAARNGCASKLVNDGRSPIAVQEGTYDGDEAYAFVFPDEADDSLVDVWVVSPSCSTDFTAQDLQR